MSSMCPHIGKCWPPFNYHGIGSRFLLVKELRRAMFLGSWGSIIRFEKTCDEVLMKVSCYGDGGRRSEKEKGGKRRKRGGKEEEVGTGGKEAKSFKGIKDASLKLFVRGKRRWSRRRPNRRRNREPALDWANRRRHPLRPDFEKSWGIRPNHRDPISSHWDGFPRS